MQQITHYFLHFIFPVIIAFLFFKPNELKVAGIFLLTMLVDADHLLATPLFDPCRCSVGFHPLHSYPAILVYMLALIPGKTRVIALGLLMHMGTDQLDCLWSSTHCL